MGNVTLTTSRRVVDERRDEIEALVRAAFDATALFKHDPAGTLEVMRREPMELMHIQSEQALQRTYEILSEELSTTPVPSIEGIRNTYRMVLSRSPELGDLNPLLMWDLSFASKVTAE
jgi:hypothetical protein